MKKALRETQTLHANNFRAAADPLPGGTGPPKFNQLEMVTTCIYRPSRFIGITGTARLPQTPSTHCKHRPPCTNSFVMTVAVIEVNNLSADVTSMSFVGTMESRLASVYNLAMSSMSSVQSYGRHRRAATFHNATIQVTNVQFSHHSFIH